MRETRPQTQSLRTQGDTLDFIARDVIQRFTAGYVFAGELPALLDNMGSTRRGS